MWKNMVASGIMLGGLAASSEAAWNGHKSVPMPSGVLQAYRSSASDPWGIGRSASDRSGSRFATPLPPGPGRVAVPRSGPRAAPVITSLAATETGHRGKKFEVIPAGWGEKPILTKHPDMFVDPSACECGPRTWANFEFLYWATQGVTPSPVVTTGWPTAAPGVAAALGQANTAVLFGGNTTLNQFRPGLRIDVGHWLHSHPGWGVSARFYFLGAISEQFIGGSNGTNVLSFNQAIPTPQGPLPVPLYAAYPGLTTGSTAASVHSNFLGGDVNLRYRMAAKPAVDFDWLAGYRVLHLGDNQVSSFDVASATLPPNQSWRALGEDRVTSQNQFHGGQMGFAASCRREQFSITLQSTVALGATVSEFDDTRIRAMTPGINGLPAGIVPMVPGVQPRSGQQTRFAVVPEVGITLGWQPGEHVRFTVGYNFIYWSHVQRAQAIYDLSPLPASGATDYWVQGINGGFELRY